MTCRRCHHEVRKFGTYGKRKLQRYRCITCKITFSEPAPKLGRHYTDPETAAKVLTLMLEGMSVRAIERFTGMHRDTILALMKTAAVKARAVLDARIQNISPNFVQVDEMWGYVHTREPNLNHGDPQEWGSAYLWLAIDSETKLLITYHLGDRNGIAAHAFISDLRKRTAGHYQITSDQLHAYTGAIREHFQQNVDFAQLRKIYTKGTGDGWYGSGQVVAAVPHVKIGRPDFKHISTSYIERSNLNVRMHVRRLTRLTNAYSKTLANHRDAIALYIAFYNFCRVHGSLSKQTPAMRAGLTDHVWTVQKLLTGS